jgi:Ca-activated chloride channel homolog
VEQFLLNPWALALAGLSGGIILLYILKLKRTEVTISSTLLWDRSVQDFKANAPWQRLRWNILMLIQILALLLLVVALARPFLFGTQTLGGRTVLIIDTSASMLATDAKPDRLDAAVSAARNYLSGLRRHDEAMIIAAGPAPRIAASFTADRAVLNSALNEVRTGAGGVADLDAALSLVSSVSQGTGSSVVIFSDGAVPQLDPFATTDLKISYYPVGETSDNLAIVGAGVRRDPFAEQYELFAAVRNYYGTMQKVDLLIKVGEELIDVRTLELQAGQRSEITLGNLPYISEPITLQLDVADPLAADNVAYLVMPPRQRYNVGLCTASESLLLRRVLGSLTDVDLFTFDGKALSGPRELPPSEVNIWVVEGDAAAYHSPAASYMFIDTTQHPSLPVEAGTVAKLDFNADPPVIPTVTGLDRGHPILRYANMAELNLQAMRRVTLKPWARAIVDASEGPLVVFGDHDGQRTLYLAFNIYDSDFPLRASFPIFMQNAVSFLGQGGAGGQQQCIPAGQRVELLAPPDAKALQVTLPDGVKRESALSTRDFTLSETAEVGLYQLAYLDEAGQPVGQAIVPVSLLNAEESAITPASALHVRGVDEAVAGSTDAAKADITGSREVKVNQEFYIWLILVALGLMGLEWYLFHTRAL